MNEKSCKDCDNRTIFYYCNMFRVDCSIQRAYNFRCKRHWQRETLRDKFAKLLIRIRNVDKARNVTID